jgi:hydrogenase maturation factor
MLTKPGLVVGIHKDKSTVLVQYDTETVTAQNMLKDIKLGDYVMVLDGVIIQIIPERTADKMMKS